MDRCWETAGDEESTLVVDTDREIYADEHRLQRLFENLFRNVDEHAGNDVTVTVGDLPDGFYVADDGPGIAPGDRDRVFELGYSTADDGTGFGLYIVKTIADAHDWEVTITDSEEAARGSRSLASNWPTHGMSDYPGSILNPYRVTPSWV
ncbi:sensor histidine kinase [Halovenus salina]|uniref:histidine kinase n=1 Tax=Halovenus salina TaxID=1510225 RepID=A0ABD5W4D3_9EURY